jgi:hypothetical protein
MIQIQLLDTGWHVCADDVDQDGFVCIGRLSDITLLAWTTPRQNRPYRPSLPYKKHAPWKQLHSQRQAGSFGLTPFQLGRLV